MVKLSIKRPKMMSHPFVRLSVEVTMNILVVSFLICIIIYIHKINKYDVFKDEMQVVPVHSVDKSLQNFINVMAWIILIMIGLYALLKVF